MNVYTHKYFLKFPMSHLNAAAYPTKLFPDFSIGDTIYLKMKEIFRRPIFPGLFLNSGFITYTD